VDTDAGRTAIVIAHRLSTVKRWTNWSSGPGQSHPSGARTRNC
jgi:hypothetical protein